MTCVTSDEAPLSANPPVTVIDDQLDHTTCMSVVSPHRPLGRESAVQSVLHGFGDERSCDAR
jgi:hypothetical protein